MIGIIPNNIRAVMKPLFLFLASFLVATLSHAQATPADPDDLATRLDQIHTELHKYNRDTLQIKIQQLRTEIVHGEQRHRELYGRIDSLRAALSAAEAKHEQTPAALRLLADSTALHSALSAPTDSLDANLVCALHEILCVIRPTTVCAADAASISALARLVPLQRHLSVLLADTATPSATLQRAFNETHQALKEEKLNLFPDHLREYNDFLRSVFNYLYGNK